ncbi:MAG: hypothetical protein Kow00127_21690 [Bacteroidales bacterium]
MLIVLMPVFSGCLRNPKANENVLARVHDEYLYESDLKEVIPEGTSIRDSVLLAQNYINSWVLDRLVVDKAEKNLNEEELDFQRQLEEYRNSLIIYKYESRLVEQMLDTNITNEEIEEYYRNNTANFQLKEDIVKVFYARFRKDLPEMKKIRGFFYGNRPEDLDSLDRYVELYSDLYFINDEDWVPFNSVLRHVPLNTSNLENYLKNHKKVEIEDDPWIWYVRFEDYKIKDGISPLDFERENIRRIILNQRKLKIIKQMRQDLYDRALENNEFEIY